VPAVFHRALVQQEITSLSLRNQSLCCLHNKHSTTENIQSSDSHHEFHVISVASHSYSRPQGYHQLHHRGSTQFRYYPVTPTWNTLNYLVVNSSNWALGLGFLWKVTLRTFYSALYKCYISSDMIQKLANMQIPSVGWCLTVVYYTDKLTHTHLLMVNTYTPLNSIV